MVGCDATEIIRNKFKQGKHGRRDDSFHVKWETYLSMEWDAEEMKTAILIDPLYERKNKQERLEIAAKRSYV
jgi:hypothetical protein